LLDARNRKAQRGYQIRYSVGQIQYDPARHASIADLLAAADAAMYSHKQASKARAVHGS
jgi:GGDEF domain-containing protein